MNIINATPPADYPAQVIVAQEQWFAAKHPDSAYWLRIAGEHGGARAIQLPGAVGPAHARRLARDAGFEPTHHTNPGDGRPRLF
jgi:hypothetical protein